MLQQVAIPKVPHKLLCCTLQHSKHGKIRFCCCAIPQTGITDNGYELTLHHLVDVLTPIHEAMALPGVHVQGHVLVAVCLHLLNELLHCLHAIACVAYTRDGT